MGGSSNWDVAQNWSAGEIPGSTQSIWISNDITSNLIITGPGSIQTIASLTIGGGQGYKTLELSNGGSLTMPGDLTIDTNGAVALSHGDLSADRIVVQGLAAVPVPPTAVVGLFEWVDGAGSSSLTADELWVRAGGIFVHDSLNGTMNVDRLTVDHGGAAVLETGPTFLQQVENAGFLDLGDRFFGNPVTIGSGGYTQQATGQIRLLLGDGAADHLDTTGGATINGQLILALSGSSTPTRGTSWTLIATDAAINGNFATIDGVLIENDLALAVTYVEDVAGDSVVATVAWVGDSSLGDGVGVEDLQLLAAHWQQVGAGWVGGD